MLRDVTTRRTDKLTHSRLVLLLTGQLTDLVISELVNQNHASALHQSANLLLYSLVHNSSTNHLAVSQVSGWSTLRQ